MLHTYTQYIYTYIWLDCIDMQQWSWSLLHCLCSDSTRVRVRSWDFCSHLIVGHALTLHLFMVFLMSLIFITHWHWTDDGHGLRLPLGFWNWDWFRSKDRGNWAWTVTSRSIHIPVGRGNTCHISLTGSIQIIWAVKYIIYVCVRVCVCICNLNMHLKLHENYLSDFSYTYSGLLLRQCGNDRT